MQQFTPEQYKQLRTFKPKSPERLGSFLYQFLNFHVPRQKICPGHSAPLDYLWHAFSCDMPGLNTGNATVPGRTSIAGEDARAPRTNGDCIVWANRGGGKTQLAAAATLLEGIFKPACHTRILAGSLDQSCRTYEYLCGFVETAFSDFLLGRLCKDSCKFTNAATVQVLAQSMRSVRGRHIHKLRCDEVELFDEEIFDAAKYITHTNNGKLAAIEMLSTMHRPYGLMQKLVDAAMLNGTPVFRWCIWETIQRCKDRSCSRCRLDEYCRGKAKKADGYLGIDDTISQMLRSSKEGFESEMLCQRPDMRNAVFSDFNPDVHVTGVGYDPMLPLYRAMDFGYRNPFVCLWIQVRHGEQFRVIDEYWAVDKLTSEHAVAVKLRTPCAESQVAGTYCDPAGKSKDSTSGESDVEELKKAGINVKYSSSRIVNGIEQIRAALKAGDGKSTLVIDPKCKLLIKSMKCYHYPDANSKLLSEVPHKDGEHDHAIDALRYFFINYKGAAKKPGCKQY